MTQIFASNRMAKMNREFIKYVLSEDPIALCFTRTSEYLYFFTIHFRSDYLIKISIIQLNLKEELYLSPNC